MFGRFGGPGPGWDAPWWQGFLGVLIPTLFLIALVVLAVWAVLRVSERRLPSAPAPLPPGGAPRDAALEQARLRYARGEMSREEYLQVSADLAGATAGEDEAT